MDVVALTGVKAYSLPKERFLGFIRGTQYERVLERLVRNRSSETWSLLTNGPKLGTLTTYQRTWLESILVPRDLKGKGTLLRQGAASSSATSPPSTAGRSPRSRSRTPGP